MHDKPKALDLFCGAGGASRGLQLAGFHVTGVDIKPQPRYCGDVFIRADALTFNLSGFDFIWASPVCKEYSITKSMWRDRSHPDQVGTIRGKLETAGLPYVIENVRGAPLRNPIMLCGQMVGLPFLYRHRYFENNLGFLVPPHPKHRGSTNASRGFSSFEKGAKVICVAGHNFRVEDAKLAMGINWMTQAELSQAIPPAYSEFLGRQIMRACFERAA